MNLNNTKKILILGSSGSGKSTLAKKLGKEHNIPVYNYDQIRWLENWQQPPREEVINKLKEITKQDSYILEGTYSSKMQDVVRDCDEIIVLAINPYLCTFRILKRTFLSFITGKKGAREDLPEGCNEKLGIGYLKFIRYTLLYYKELEEMFEEIKFYNSKIKVYNRNSL
jgi:adenylate kinase family enzyme